MELVFNYWNLLSSFIYRLILDNPTLHTFYLE